MKHDEASRGLWSILNGLVVISDTERKKELENIRDTLMPDGLSGTQATYLFESGRVALVKSRMTPAMEKTLKETILPNASNPA